MFVRELVCGKDGEMALSVIAPKGKGALLLDAHPAGCAQSVATAAAEVASLAPLPGPAPRVLVIGSSSGYGHAITIAGLLGLSMSGIGLSFERPASGRRTASAGWYRTGCLAALAEAHQADFEFVNGDCYAEETKRSVLDRLAQRYGQIDYLIYSVAAPRRTEADGTVHQSVIKPLGEAHTTYSVDFEAGGRELKEIGIEPATAAEVRATVTVMGGEDWADWVAALSGRDLLAAGFTTVALSYIGSALTAPIYRHGTIGQAKDHLEATAGQLTATLAPVGGRAVTSVHGAAVTQASSAIPGISLYLSLLHEVLGDDMQSPARQGHRLWRHLTGAELATVDAEGRIRLDDWEFAGDVPAEVARRWQDAVRTRQVPSKAGQWFVDEVHRQYGFAVPGVDYSEPVEVDLPWPAVAEGQLTSTDILHHALSIHDCPRGIQW